jgi:Terminase RNaseH-like domain
VLKSKPDVLKKATQAIEQKWKQNIDNLNPDPNPYSVPESLEEFVRACRIRTGSGYQLFELYDYQVELLKLLDLYSDIIVIKDRQLGVTEVLAAFAYYKSLTDPAYSSAFVSITQDKSAEIASRVNGMASRAWKIKWAKNNQSELHPLGCGIMRFLPCKVDAARGLPAVNAYVLDEAGALDDFTELYAVGASCQATVPDDRRRTVLNTTIPIDGMANPVWGMFATDNETPALEYIRAARGAGTNCGIPGMYHWVDRSGCCKIIIGHKAHPLYGQDPDYLENVRIKKKIPMAIVQRENNLGIEVAGNSLFNEASIVSQSIGNYADPLPNRKYMAMVDPNFGGSDRWVTLIFDVTESPISLVAEYAESDRSVEYSEDISIDLCDRYKVAAIAVESNSGGKIVVEDFHRKRPNLSIMLTLTSNSSKRTNTDRVAFAIEQGHLIYPSEWGGMREMRSFSASTREAVAGEKDDRVMALAAGFAHLNDVRSIQESYPSTFDGDPL